MIRLEGNMIASVITIQSCETLWHRPQFHRFFLVNPGKSHSIQPEVPWETFLLTYKSYAYFYCFSPKQTAYAWGWPNTPSADSQRWFQFCCLIRPLLLSLCDFSLIPPLALVRLLGWDHYTFCFYKPVLQQRFWHVGAGTVWRLPVFVTTSDENEVFFLSALSSQGWIYVSRYCDSF